MSLPWIVAALSLVVPLGVCFFLWAFLRRRPEESSPLVEMQSQLSSLHQDFQNKVQEVQREVGEMNKVVAEHLKENLKVMQSSQGQVGTRLDNAAKVIGEVQSRLGKMEEANERIFEVGKSIAGLQEILQAPKLRGSLGEFFLAELLAQIMPTEHFSLQYRFKSGEVVDAIINLGGKFVPVDSKFPLENFKKMSVAQEESEKKSARRLFKTDVKKHVDAIANKYIRPDEGTFDFALMYIPAENVYYETIIKDEELGGDKILASYALSRRVVPVSPNNFYAYLNTILLGLRGFKVEKSVQEIMANMASLKGDLETFVQDFTKIGTHLNHARSSYENSDKRLLRFQDKLTNLELSDAKEPLRALK
jgi:DNA recombination protein RmuC